MKIILLAGALAMAFNGFSQKAVDAKDDIKPVDDKEIKDGWTSGGGLGLDLSILSLINPRIGAGSNQTKYGGLLNYYAKYKKGKFIWDSKANWLTSVLSVSGQPSTKAADALQLTSQMGYAFAPKWYFAGLADLQTQLLPTYGLNYLDQTVNGVVQPLNAKFFAPATLKIAPGVIYKYDTHLTLFYSPVALKAIIVADNGLAGIVGDSAQQLGRLGNPWRSPTDFDNVDLQIGSEFRADYTNKFFNDKMLYAGTLDLYSNYRRNPQNIAVEFYNSFDYLIAKNFSLNFKSDWFYDDRVLVQLSGDPNRLGKNLFIRNALLLKYAMVF